MKTSTKILVIITLLTWISCARSTSDINPCITGHIYGFWAGLWHGLIAPIDLLVSLFSKDVFMYAPNNNGNWYALGFLFGSGGWGLLAGKSTNRKKS